MHDYHSVHKTVIIIIDSLGVGSLPDSFDYDDRDVNCLTNVSEFVGRLNIPYLSSLGLTNITYVMGNQRLYDTKGFYGKIYPYSLGKEKLIAYWEMTGIQTEIVPTAYTEDIPEEVLHKFKQISGHNFLGGRFGSCHEILQEEFLEHRETKRPIIYASPDGSIQVAADINIIPLNDLYKICFSLRRICDKHKIMRLIAKPFTGDTKAELLSDKEKIFAMPAPQPGVLDALSIRDIPIYSVGRVSDFFNDLGFWETHKPGSYTGNLDKAISLLRDRGKGKDPREVIMVEYNHDYHNIDMSMDYITSYAAFLEGLDSYLPVFMREMYPEDILIIVGDQPGDPTGEGKIFTREYIPILIFSKLFKPYDIGNIGIRKAFSDIAISLAEMYGFSLPYMVGESFWYKVSSHM